MVSDLRSERLQVAQATTRRSTSAVMRASCSATRRRRGRHRHAEQQAISVSYRRHRGGPARGWRGPFTATPAEPQAWSMQSSAAGVCSWSTTRSLFRGRAALGPPCALAARAALVRGGAHQRRHPPEDDVNVIWDLAVHDLHHRPRMPRHVRDRGPRRRPESAPLVSPPPATLAGAFGGLSPSPQPSDHAQATATSPARAADAIAMP